MSKRRGLWLIGSPTEEILGAKLPSNRQVLLKFMFEHKERGHTLRESATLTTRSLLTFWEKARIPVRKEWHIIAKVEALHKSWKTLRKSASRRTDVQKEKEESFVNQMEDLFDIAHADALINMTNEEDKCFLLSQREKGRQGCLEAVDKVLDLREQRRREREVKNEERLEREERKRTAQSLDATPTSEGNLGSEEETDDELMQNDTTGPVPGTSTEPSKRKRGRKSVLSSEVAFALDRTNISNRKATFVVGATVQALGMDVGDFSLNRETLRRQRRLNREQIAEELKKSFKPTDPLTVHWDGKLLPALTSKDKVDRLAILVSSPDSVKLLGVPVLQQGTGSAQAEAVYDALIDWNVTPQVQAMSFDTTSSNTGKDKGACSLLEVKLGRKLLHLACRQSSPYT